LTYILLLSWVSHMPTKVEMQEGTTPDEVTCPQKEPVWFGRKKTTLRQHWLDYNEPHHLHRIIHHADAYDRHAPPRHGSAPLKMLEIGVQSGGSVRAWKSWYGSRLTYVGVDIEPKAKRSESRAENIFIEIGSQSNTSFLLELCLKYGPFDFVIDDGGHTPKLIDASLRVIFPESSPCMTHPSLYVIEDTQTMNYKGFSKNPSEMYDIFGSAIWALHYKEGRSRAPLVPFGSMVSAVHAYDSIIFLTRARHVEPQDVKRGNNCIPPARC
jgi:hypothetical protein